MSKISIVTAFFDIGRGDWNTNVNKNGGPLPHYLQRSVDTYIQNFSHLAKLDNEIIVFTSTDLVSKIQKVSEKIKVLPYDVFSHNKDKMEKIETIQKNELFLKNVNPSQVKNPEYWSPHYVLVTNLKAFFVNKAIEDNLINNEMVAWIDFGYCRDANKIPKNGKWNYDFDEEKIHLFNYKSCEDASITGAIYNNDVYILGAKIIAHKKNWPKMDKLMEESFYDLYEMNLIDDDQGLLLYSYLKDSSSFELHKIPDHQLGYDPFVLFQKFNSNEQNVTNDLLYGSRKV